MAQARKWNQCVRNVLQILRPTCKSSSPLCVSTGSSSRLASLLVHYEYRKADSTWIKSYSMIQCKRCKQMHRAILTENKMNVMCFLYLCNNCLKSSYATGIGMMSIWDRQLVWPEMRFIFITTLRIKSFMNKKFVTLWNKLHTKKLPACIPVSFDSGDCDEKFSSLQILWFWETHS